MTTTAQPNRKKVTTIHTKDIFFLLNKNPASFIDEGSTWNFSGASCFSLEPEMDFHLNLSLTPGRMHGGVKLEMGMTECNPNRKQNWLPRLRKLVVKLNYTNEHEQTLHENCFQIEPKSSWEEMNATLEDFMTRKTLDNLYVHKKKGDRRLLSSSNDCDIDPGNMRGLLFVKLTAQLELTLEAVNQYDHSFTLAKCNLTSFRCLLTTTRCLAASTCDPNSESEERAISTQCLPSESLPKGTKTVEPIIVTKLSPAPGDSETSGTPSSRLSGSKFSEMVTFKVGPGESIFIAYKYKIMALSPVFERKLTVDMMEKNENVILLKEEDPQMVQNLLSLLNSNTEEDFNSQVLDLPALEILDLLGFAHMYELKQLLRDLKTALVTFPSDKLTPETVLDIFVAGCKFDMPDLKFRALQLMKGIRSKIWCMGDQMEFEKLMAGKDPKYLSNLIFELL